MLSFKYVIIFAYFFRELSVLFNTLHLYESNTPVTAQLQVSTVTGLPYADNSSPTD
jgi:hypothetical protein